jgi:hypothetical protein
MMSPFLIDATLGTMHRFRETEQRAQSRVIPTNRCKFVYQTSERNFYDC